MFAFGFAFGLQVVVREMEYRKNKHNRAMVRSCRKQSGSFILVLVMFYGPTRECCQGVCTGVTILLIAFTTSCGPAAVPASESAWTPGSPGQGPRHPPVLSIRPPPAAAPARPTPPAVQMRKPAPTPQPAPAPAYALDPVSRKIPITGRASCPPIDLIRYSGSIVRFHKSLRIAEPFRDHVRDFEQIVHDTAIEVYGRPPTHNRHYGSYFCRRISTWPYLVSEHGMGNAVDIGGFYFARLRKGEFPDARRRYRKKFSITVSRHWRGTGADADHARFLRLVARRAIERAGLFRVILGPAHPGHDDHLHLDMARWRVVNVF